MEGLARLEYRGYDSAGVALIDRGRHQVREAGRQAREPAPTPSSAPAPGVAHRHRAHPVGHPRRAHRRQRPPAPRRHDGRPLIHNGIIENFHALKKELLAEGVEFQRETDTEVAAKLSAGSTTSRVTSPRRCARRQLEGASRCSRCTPTARASWSAPAQQPAGRRPRRRRELPRSDVAAFIGHTRQALELGPGPDRHDHPGRRHGHRLRRHAGRGQALRGRLGRRRRREGRLPHLHAEGDPRAAARGGRHPRRPHRRLGPPRPRRVRIGEDQLRTSTGSSSSPAARPPTRAWSPSTPSSTGPASRSRSSLAHEFRYCDPIVDGTTRSSSRSASPARRWTRSWPSSTPASWARDPVDLQHPRLDDPARVRRRALHPRRPGDRRRLDQGVPRPDHRLLRARLYLAQLRGGTYADDAKAVMAELQEIPAKIEDLLGRMDRVVEMANFMADTRSVLFLGRNVGYPVAMEGALKLKELAYIHAEGFAAGELKHGPIALIDAGQPVFIVVPSPDTPARAAQEGRLQHPGDPRPRRPHHRHRPRRRRGRRPFADEVIRIPRSPRSPPAARGRAAAGLRAAPVDGQGPGRRPAAEPREVGHGRVTLGWPDRRQVTGTS